MRFIGRKTRILSSKRKDADLAFLYRQEGSLSIFETREMKNTPICQLRAKNYVVVIDDSTYRPYGGIILSSSQNKEPTDIM